MKLYEITDQFKQLEKMEGIDPEVMRDTLDSISGDVAEKGKGVAAYFQNLDAEVNAMKDAEARIKARRVSIEKNSEFLKGYLLRNMLECEVTEISCPEFKITIRKPQKVVNIYGDVNSCYINTKIVETVNKAAIKSHLKEGIDIAGAELVDGKTSLIIK